MRKAERRDALEPAHEIRQTASALLARDNPVPGGRTAVAVSPGGRRPVALAKRACLGLGGRRGGSRPADLAIVKICPPSRQRGGAARLSRFGRAFAELECHRTGSLDRDARNRG